MGHQPPIFRVEKKGTTTHIFQKFALKNLLATKTVEFHFNPAGLKATFYMNGATVTLKIH